VNVLTDLRSAPKLNAKIRKSVRDDRDLIEAYADIADQAALRETEPSLNMIGTRAAAYTRALSTWRPNSPHPALATCAPSFKSFEGTLKKFVWPEAATSPAT
jgi:hypothetical protein